ncbi:MAG TPA: cellulase family glycosylhydrolase [Bacilli bacterium]
MPFRKLSAFCAIMLSFCTFSPAVHAASKTDTSALQSFVDSMNPGWNLGNTFDAAGDETSWGNPRTTKELIKHIAAAGYKSIRIPITWNHRLGTAPEYKIAPDFLARIQEVIDWCLSEDLYVMINLHHDSQWVYAMETDHDGVMAKFKAVWTQIAAYFKTYPDKLLFESINEPRFSEDWNKDDPAYFSMVHELQTTFVKTVRESGGNNTARPLVLTTVTGAVTQKRMDELAKTIASLHDNRLIATIHYYGLYPFSINLGVTSFNRQVQDDVTQTFDRAYNTFVTKGIPVIVGEYGLLGFDKGPDTIEHGELLKYFEYVEYYARQKKLTLMLWDNGSFYDRSAFKWKDPALYAVMKAGWDGKRSSYTESDQLYLKNGEIRDVSLPLYLNENSLDGIFAAGKPLTEGTDYEQNTDSLTLKAKFLRTILAADSDFGVKTVLMLKFSAGADWAIEVIQYDTPMLKNNDWTGDLFPIPTEFRGDRLASLEAVYKSGGNVGPDDWTPFQEWGKTFSPRYDINTIILKQPMLAQMKDGDITLRLHFYSGETIEYTLTKNEQNITGVSSQPQPNTPDAADGNGGNSPDNGASAAAGQANAPAKHNNRESRSLALKVVGTVGILLFAGAALFFGIRRKKQPPLGR